MPLSFYNSLTKKQEEFKSRKPGKTGLYTCGPTVYNFAHIGNFRAYIFEDLLRRTLEYYDYKVNHIMNLTDVDDKTIRDSQKEGKSLNDFTEVYKKAFFEDIEKIRITPANFYPAATDHIQEMIDLIEKLFEKGLAYQADDKSVYFSISRYPNYGQLVNIQPDQLRPGTRVQHDEYSKESVSDFALWKSWTEGDGDVKWDSPWGPGRPGWHLECSAMSLKYLGKSFDIHCGGIDNMFPHHEDEIAQSEGANGCKFVNYWLHCAHLVVDGEKMSKSLGNFYTLREVLNKGYTGREVRYVLLGTHYRQSLNFSFKACDDARTNLNRTDALIIRLKEVAASGAEDKKSAEEVISKAAKKFKDGIGDDLNISAALAALFDFVRDTNKELNEENFGAKAVNECLDFLRSIDTVLDVLDVDKEEEAPEEIKQMAFDRLDARKNKDFAKADELRDAILAAGWTVEDTPKGPRLKKA